MIVVLTIVILSSILFCAKPKYENYMWNSHTAKREMDFAQELNDRI